MKTRIRKWRQCCRLPSEALEYRVELSLPLFPWKVTRTCISLLWYSPVCRILPRRRAAPAGSLSQPRTNADLSQFWFKCEINPFSVFFFFYLFNVLKASGAIYRNNKYPIIPRCLRLTVAVEKSNKSGRFSPVFRLHYRSSSSRKFGWRCKLLRKLPTFYETADDWKRTECVNQHGVGRFVSFLTLQVPQTRGAVKDIHESFKRLLQKFGGLMALESFTRVLPWLNCRNREGWS